MRQAQYKRSVLRKIFDNFLSKEEYYYSFAAGILFGVFISLYLVTGGQ